MVDLAYVSPNQKQFVIGGDATYKFIYVKDEPTFTLSRKLNQEIIDKIDDIYSSTVHHERILKMHTPLIALLNETNIDNISAENVISIIKDLITLDYKMFIDLMTILAVMLEAKDIENKSSYIDFIVNISQDIGDLYAELQAPTIENSTDETQNESESDN